jgi:uncharacterized protein (TIGR03083 family)
VPTLADTRATFAEAADAFVGLAGRIPRPAYDGPGLGDWDLRALVGHTSRSLVTVATYLAERADAVEVESAAAYYVAVSRIAAVDADGAIHRRGVEAGQALGDDPVTALREWRAAAEAALDRLGSEDAAVPTAGGGMRVSDYLPTRTFELTVHALDIATAVGLDHETPPGPLAESVRLAADSAVALGLGEDVLLALTGRRPLPPGASVVP